MIAQYLAAYTYIWFGLSQLLLSLQPSFTIVSASWAEPNPREKQIAAFKCPM